MTLAEATVLIVDDEPVLNLTMGLVLKREGATVLSGANGAEALRILESQTVHAMVCDQNMPVMDGRTLLATLVQRGLTVPTLFFAMDAGPEETSALEAAGVCGLLSKPIQPAALLDALRSVLTQVPASSA